MTEIGTEEDGGGQMEKRTQSQGADTGEENRGEANSPHTQSAKWDFWQQEN